MKKIFFYLIVVLALNTCNTINKKTTSLNLSTRIVQVPIVEKRFIKKNGEPTDRKELYLQMSIQDYYIKFCESKIKESDLKEQLDRQTGLIKTLKLEVAFKTGEWDRCGEEAVQSRVGDYVIVYQIFD